MSDRVSAPRRGVAAVLGLAVLDVVGVLLVAVLIGLGVARIWLAWWTPPPGGVQQGTWLFEDYAAIGDVFDGVGTYVLLGLGGGAVLGLVAALLARRSPILTLVAVAAGAVLAGEVCRRSGLALSPPNPRLFAGALPDGTDLPDTLRLPFGSPVIAWPVGALAGLAAVYLLRPFTRADRDRLERERQEWQQGAAQQFARTAQAWPPPPLPPTPGS